MPTAYDRGVLALFADRLYARARTIVVVWALLGAIIGLGLKVWLDAGLRIHEASGVLGWGLVGVAVLIGVNIGWERSLMLRVEAQKLLCQVAIEMGIRELVLANTRGTIADVRTS